MGVGIPTYTIRVRVVDINGATPLGTYNFWLGQYGYYYTPDTNNPYTSTLNRVVPVETTSGTGWSNWMTIDGSKASTLSTAYQAATNSWAYQGRYDFYITDLAMASVTQYTNIAGEIVMTETGEVRSFTAKLYPSNFSVNSRVGIMAYREDPTTTGLLTSSGANVTPRGCTLRQYNEDHYDALALAAFGGVPPQHQLIHVSDYFGGGDLDHLNDVAGWRMMANLGVTVAVTTTHDAHLLQVLSDAGITKRNHEWYYPPDAHHDWMRYTNGDLYGQGDAPAIYTNNVSDLVTRVLGNNLAPIHHLSLADEPFEYAGQGHNLDGSMICGFDMLEMALNTQGSVSQANSPMTPTLSSYALGKFRQFLQDNGVTLADVGAGSWSTVNPLGQQLTSDTLSSRILWYWTAQWLHYDMALHYAAFSSAIRAQFGANIPITLNLHNGAGRSTNVIACSHAGSSTPTEFASDFDWFEMARVGGPNQPSAADYTPDGYAWVSSLRQNRLDQSARKNSAGTKGAMWYATPISTHNVPGGATRKLVAALGHGANTIRRYRFGPVHSGVDGYGERILSQPLLIQGFVEEHAIIQSVETDLFPATPVRPTEVGVVFGRSAQVWDKQTSTAYAWDATNLYATVSVHMDWVGEQAAIAAALQISAIPYKWLEEEDLTADTLASYKVIYLAAPNLTTAGQTALANWVSTGGILWTAPGAAHANHYDTATNTLRTLGGITEASRTRTYMTNSAAVGVLTATVAGPGGSTSAVGVNADLATWRSSLVGTTGTVIATWSNDSSAAIIKVPYNSGYIYKCGFFAGLTMTRGAHGSGDVVWSGFDALAAAWITKPVTDLPTFKRQVEGLPFKTEATFRASSSKCLAHIVKWTDTVDSISNLRIRPTFNDGSPMTSVSSIRSYNHGLLAYTQTSDGVVLSSPYSLQYADILTLSSGASPPPSTSQESWGALPL